MARLKLDKETLGLGSFLEKNTGATVKDCFREDDGTVYFVVAKGQLGKALGKKGANIKKVQHELRKKVRVIEFSDDVEEFARNVIFPAKVEEIAQENGDLVLRDKDRKTKSLLIGRGGKNLKLINKVIKRFYDVNEIKVE